MDVERGAVDAVRPSSLTATDSDSADPETERLEDSSNHSVDDETVILDGSLQSTEFVFHDESLGLSLADQDGAHQWWWTRFPRMVRGLS